jgi:hypothetical protein
VSQKLVKIKGIFANGQNCTVFGTIFRSTIREITVLRIVLKSGSRGKLEVNVIDNNISLAKHGVDKIYCNESAQSLPSVWTPWHRQGSRSLKIDK